MKLDSRRILPVLLVTVGIMLLQSCATPGSPSGGPRDQLPPVVMPEESSPNPAVNFADQRFYVTFNEWVLLENPGAQIVVSPPLEFRPEVGLKRRTVEFEFDRDEELRPNTTYVINFGDAIQDITERNVLKNFSYVFSTGSFVDSLSVQGSIVSAVDNRPVENALVILHDAPGDSVLYEEIPSYLASATETGAFTINYMRSDTFRAFALQDNNLNYKYDPPQEWIGFLDESFVLSSTDTMAPRLELKLFQEDPELRVVRRFDQYGVVKVALTMSPFALGLAGDTAALERWKVEGDTLFAWHRSPDTLNIVLNKAGEPFDTLLFYPFRTPTTRALLSAIETLIHPDNALNLVANAPIQSVDPSRFACRVNDAPDGPPLTIRTSADGFKVAVHANWSEKTRYVCQVDPGAITDAVGRTNDTLRMLFNVDERLNYSNLNLAISGLDSTKHYIFELLNEQNVERTVFMPPGHDHTLAFRKVYAREYDVRIVEDRNANGRWDTGSLLKRIQPEQVYFDLVTGLRPGWDVDLDIMIEDR